MTYPTINQYEYDPEDDGKYYYQIIKTLLELDDNLINTTIIDIVAHRVKYDEQLPEYIITDYSDELSEVSSLSYKSMYKELINSNPEIVKSILLDTASQINPEYIELWSYANTQLAEVKLTT